jgi:hypothetical protein
VFRWDRTKVRSHLLFWGDFLGRTFGGFLSAHLGGCPRDVSAVFYSLVRGLICAAPGRIELSLLSSVDYPYARFWPSMGSTS